jgi:hypothetical protein
MKCEVSVVSKTADVLVPGCKKIFAVKVKSLKAEYQLLLTKHHDAEAQLKELFKILCDIEDVAGYTPASVEEIVEWISIVIIAEDN